MAHDDPGPQSRDRHPGRPEQGLDLAAAAQVRGEFVVIVAETAEVDDPAEPGLGGGAAEVQRRSGVALREVRVGQGVHQVVGGLRTGHGERERLAVLHVAVDRGACTAVGLGPAGHGLQGVTGGLQRRAEPPSHEPRRPGDQNLHQRTGRAAVLEAQRAPRGTGRAAGATAGGDQRGAFDITISATVHQGSW